MLWRLSFFLALLTCASVNAVEVKPYIVNGNTATVSDYPSFASLFYRNNKVYSTRSFCGATMINSQYVLTAAHCVYGDDDMMLYTVVAPQLQDESQFLSNEQARAAEFYYPDTFINSSVELWPDDIAIIKLESALSTGNLRSLLNSSLNNSYPPNSEFRAVGHGYIEDDVRGGTELLETEMDYVPIAQCRFEIGTKITSKQLCFGGETINGLQNSTCTGDSGGPIYYFDGMQYVQVGITSFGPASCGDPNYSVSSIYTDVYDYQAWITKVLNGEVEPKAYVEVRNGVRVLINNDPGGADPDTVSTIFSRSGGGALSFISAISLFVIWMLRNALLIVIYRTKL